MAQFTQKQLKSQAKARSRNEKSQAKTLAKRSNNQQGLVDYGQHQKSDWRHSTNGQAVRYPKFDEQQQQVLRNLTNLLSGGVNNLSLPGNNRSSFAPIKAESQRRFHQETVPTIAERFQSLGGQDGSGGALSSPDLYKQLGGAGAQLDSQLAALEAQYGLQQQGMESNNLFNLLSAGLGSRFDMGVIPGQDSGLRQGWNQVKNAIPGAIAGGITGGPAGAAYGGLSGLGLGQVGDALQQRQGGQYDQMQDFGTGNLYNNYNQASQQRYQQQNSTGFTPQQGIGFGGNNSLSTSGINNSIYNGYTNNLMPSSNQYLFPTQF